MRIHKSMPVALTIAGSDSGGGAGIQADLKVFAALGVHGASAITCITAQNPTRVTAIHACSPKMVRAQMEAVFAELPPAAAKTGMLFSSNIIGAVVEFFSSADRCPLVVDPVMIATSGATLLKKTALKAMERLLCLADLVTPNLDEARVLTGMNIRSVEDMRAAARCIRDRFGCAALVKGGHLQSHQEAIDIFFDGGSELLLSAPFVRGVSTHGTGCTYSAAITAGLAQGKALAKAVQQGKEFITGAVIHSQRVANHQVLNCFWRQPTYQSANRSTPVMPV